MGDSGRRAFLSAVGTVSLGALAGCTGRSLPLGGNAVDRTLYVGAYHWGFVVLDEAGNERERVVLDRGARVRMVAFSMEADAAIESLPDPIRARLPSHESLEGRNDSTIPAPNEAVLEEALSVAEERYPVHSVAVVPAGAERGGMGGMMGGGSMGALLGEDDDGHVGLSGEANDRGGAFSLERVRHDKTVRVALP
ncbi:MAG: hypothetical protein ABEJ59_02830 [Halanaeroarchaeum sp.]